MHRKGVIYAEINQIRTRLQVVNIVHFMKIVLLVIIIVIPLCVVALSVLQMLSTRKSRQLHYTIVIVGVWKCLEQVRQTTKNTTGTVHTETLMFPDMPLKFVEFRADSTVLLGIDGNTALSANGNGGVQLPLGYCWSRADRYNWTIDSRCRLHIANGGNSGGMSLGNVERILEIVHLDTVFLSVNETTFSQNNIVVSHTLLERITKIG